MAAERLAETRRPAVFLDRDGTLIEDRGHLRDPAEVVFYPDALDALRRLQERFLLFIVTNQNGIAKGILTADEVDRVNAHVVARLQGGGVLIREVYTCPHQRSDGCGCIKPRPHFPRRAAAAYGVDLEASWSVGDHPSDAELARGVGGTGIFVLTGHGEKHRGEIPPDVPVAAGIGEAADLILGRRPTPGARPS